MKTALEIANAINKRISNCGDMKIEVEAKVLEVVTNAVVKLTEENEGLKLRLHLNAQALKGVSQALKEAEELLSNLLSAGYEEPAASKWLAKYGEKK